MKKLYYKPVILGVAALALGSQLNTVTTVFAEETTTQDVAAQPTTDKLAEAKAAFVARLDKLNVLLNGEMSGTSPQITALKSRLVYTKPAVNRASSLESLQTTIDTFNSELKADDVTFDTINVTVNGTDVTLENVPLHKGDTVKNIALPDAINEDGNLYLDIQQAADGTVTATVMAKKTPRKIGMPLTNTAVDGATATVNTATPESALTDIDKVAPETDPEKPADPTTKPEETKPGKDTDKGTDKNTGKDATKPADTKKDDDKTTKPAEKPADSKSIVEHKTTFVANNDHFVMLHDENGKTLNSRGLGKDTAWVADKMMTLNGVKYLRVATNEWAKLSDGMEVELLSTTVTTSKLAQIGRAHV